MVEGAGVGQRGGHGSRLRPVRPVRKRGQGEGAMGLLQVRTSWMERAAAKVVHGVLEQGARGHSTVGCAARTEVDHEEAEKCQTRT